MKNKATLITTLITIVFAVTVIVGIGVVTAKRTTAPRIGYTTYATVKDGVIVEDENDNQPIAFNPIGEKCLIDIIVTGPDELISDIEVCTDTASSEPLLSFDCSSIEMTSQELDVNNRSILVLTSVRLNEEIDVKDGDYQVRYEVILHGMDTSSVGNGLVLIVTLCIVAFVVFLGITLNRNAVSNKEFDERQLRMRGIAALNAMVTAACILMGFGMIDIIVDNFPFSVYQVTMVTAIVSVTVFAIIADVNDAYFGIKNKRKIFIILTAIIAATQLFSGLVNGVLSTREDIFSNMSVVSSVTGICFLCICIEMIIKGIIEKKEALKEAEDEESET